MEGEIVDWDRNRFRVDSKDLCGSLVEVHTDDTVALVHHTAKRQVASDFRYPLFLRRLAILLIKAMSILLPKSSI